MKQAEKKHLSRVAALGCIACQKIGYEDTPASIHHLREGMGAGQRNDNYHVIPLCPIHHQLGPDAFHRSKVNFEANFGTELELLAEVNNQLGVE